MEEFIEKFPKIDQSQLLSDEQLNSIEGGACKESCKQACQPGNMNGTVEKSDINVSGTVNASGNSSKGTQSLQQAAGAGSEE
ncbi:MAG: hypothetical protein LBG15_04305 [Dysgonamonadaceae bacterium]|jgi:hypothetical protein|nr:hypothetical protein [Dysgonamonadaceae bacterium]